MKKGSIFLLLSLVAILGGITSSYAHENEGHPSPKHAIRELHEAKEIPEKLSPDSTGHIAKASQAVDQAMQELSAIKAEPQKA